MHTTRWARIAAGGLMVGFGTCAAALAAPWGASVASFDVGAGGVPGYDNPLAVLGEPTRYTGVGVFPSAVTMFNPPYGTDELFSFGYGGHVTIAFDQPITNDPSNLYGIDLIIFGNGGFIDEAYPNGQITDPALLFGAGPMRVLVSENGVDFVDLGTFTEGLFPTQGYLDVGPFDEDPGSLLTDFTRPMNPALTADDFSGLSYAQALALYDGSGGGTPIDIGPSGLESVWFVRIEAVAPGATVEIDAVAIVPEPTSLCLLLFAGLTGSAFRRKK